MDETKKYYTVAEANQLLPYLAPTLVELREKFEEAATIRIAVTQAAGTNGGSPHRDSWSKTLARVAELMERLGNWEVQLRDISIGLVDFPTLVDEREAWLCWRLGESEVSHWHPPDEGFSGRQPI